MSRTSTFIKAAAAVSLLGTLASTASTAQASLAIDLRFPTGNAKSKTLTAGDVSPITVNVWAVATGAAGAAGNEGVQSAIAAFQSQIVSAGFAGSITSAAIGSGWGGSGASAGAASNLTADGIGDWGNVNNTPLSLPASYFRARTTKATNNQVDWGDANSPAGSSFNTLADGGVEFLIGSFVFTPTASPAGASLNINPAVPLGGTVAPAGWYEDTADKTAASPTGSKAVATGGVFGPQTPNAAGTGGVNINVGGIPEPTSLSLLGLGALALVRRRRA